MNNIEKTEAIVIGAGLIGLAIARILAIHGREVIILEQEDTLGMHTSSRNSEVIHSGLYYPQQTLKSRLCVKGKTQLYDYCESHAIDYSRCGKLIMACNENQLGDLKVIHKQALANCVNDLVWLDQQDTYTLEPELACSAALYSPSSGIIDSHALMLSLLGDAERCGCVISFKSPVIGGRISDKGVILQVGGQKPIEITAQTIINCSGLFAYHLASQIEDFPKNIIPEYFFGKGHYFSYCGRNPFSHLIYPVPDPASLGIHATLDLNGQLRFGPDLEWLPAINYEYDNKHHKWLPQPNYHVKQDRVPQFYDAIRQYWPGLPDNSLQPAYAGIRPKLHGADKSFADFMIQDKQIHGIEGLVQLFGIESPGLTASLAIADYVLDLVEC